MNLKLFYSPPTWLGFIAPEKPDMKDYGANLDGDYYRDLDYYEYKLAEAKANALEVGNEDVLIKEMNFELEPLREVLWGGKVIDWPGSAVIKDGKYILSI